MNLVTSCNVDWNRMTIELKTSLNNVSLRLSISNTSVKMKKVSLILCECAVGYMGNLTYSFMLWNWVSSIRCGFSFDGFSVGFLLMYQICFMMIVFYQYHAEKELEQLLSLAIIVMLSVYRDWNRIYSHLRLLTKFLICWIIDWFALVP